MKAGKRTCGPAVPLPLQSGNRCVHLLVRLAAYKSVQSGEVARILHSYECKMIICCSLQYPQDVMLHNGKEFIIDKSNKWEFRGGFCPEFEKMRKLFLLEIYCKVDSNFTLTLDGRSQIGIRPA